MPTPRAASLAMTWTVAALVSTGSFASVCSQDAEPSTSKDKPDPNRSPESLLRKALEARALAERLTLEAASAFDARGAEHFKRGRFKESVADFDQAVALDPRRKPWHWRRGISYYYTGQFVEGQKQFEGYQTVDDSDVENAAWRYLCMARRVGVPEARKTILKIGDDRRVPMRQIYDLYAGKLKPDDVLAATEAGQPSPAELNQRRFYAHLYLGLYWEVNGKPELAKKHLLLAADKHRIGHYMWDVARVHADLYRTKGSKPPGDKGAKKPAEKKPAAKNQPKVEIRF